MAKLKAKRIYRDEQQSIILVESIDFQYEKAASMLGFFAKSHPIAIIVMARNRTYAVSVNAEPADLDRLIRDAEGLSTLLEQSAS